MIRSWFTDLIKFQIVTQESKIHKFINLNLIKGTQIKEVMALKSLEIRVLKGELQFLSTRPRPPKDMETK